MENDLLMKNQGDMGARVVFWSWAFRRFGLLDFSGALIEVVRRTRDDHAEQGQGPRTIFFLNEQ